jgi:mannose-1-phosphate guanylyltransferase
MRALLLAAGRGTRLRPTTDFVPKCLVTIQQRPLLDYWFDSLLLAGIERILVNTSYLADQVRAHVAASRWSDSIDLVHEDELLGTGGTVLANRCYFGRQPFLVAHADNLTDFEVSGFVQAHAHRPSCCAMTMLAFRTDTPQLCGILKVDADGILYGFHEKVNEPPGNLANGAVYVLEPEILDAIAGWGRRFVDLSTEVIPGFIGRIHVVEHSGYHRDIGNLASLELANRTFFGARTYPLEPQRQSGGDLGATMSIGREFQQ